VSLVQRTILEDSVNHSSRKQKKKKNVKTKRKTKTKTKKKKKKKESDRANGNETHKKGTTISVDEGLGDGKGMWGFYDTRENLEILKKEVLMRR